MSKSFVFALSLIAIAGAVFAAPPARLPVAPMPHLPGERPLPDLTNEDIGIDPKIELTLPNVERLDQKTVNDKVTQDNVGLPNVTGLKLPGLDPSGFNLPGFGVPPGVRADEPKTPPSGPFPGRTGATKTRLLKEAGGNAASELAVVQGLAWLARQQQQDGGWKFDAGKTEERTCATGMALLPFLAAGVTHKKKEEKDFKGYDVVVSKGLGFLMKACPLTGANAGRLSTDVYSNAIAALPLCEAYGMTKDPALKPYAQAAVNFIQKTQGPNGSWGYGNTGNGDTSIVGWQVQVLQAAKLSKDLVVDDKVIAKAVKFLDFTAAGAKKSMYGYNDNAGAAPGTALTSIGLLSRYYFNAWGPAHPGMIDGVGGLMKNSPAASGGLKNMYYYYYATQVVHYFGGDDWVTWNEGPKAADGTRKGGMRDWFINQQIKKDANNGSWDPEAGFIGSSCGRLGTTAMCVLTLEVYYRHLPLHKRAADSPKPDDKK